MIPHTQLPFTFLVLRSTTSSPTMFGIFTLNARINQSLAEKLCPVAKQKKLEREKAELQKNLQKMEKRDGRKRTRVRKLVASKLRSRYSTTTVAAQASPSRSSSPRRKKSSQAIKTAKIIGSTIVGMFPPSSAENQAHSSKLTSFST